MRVAKYKKLSPRTENLMLNADRLLKDGYYVASIFYYVIYIEQLLFTAYLYVLRKKDIETAILGRENILLKRERGYFPFGKVVTYTIPLIDEYLNYQHTLPMIQGESLVVLCQKLVKIRNVISAHPQFALMLDPNNRWKRALYDANYYRKVLRRIRRFLKVDLNVESPPILDEAIDLLPLVSSAQIETEFAKVENEVARALALYSKNISIEIRSRLKGIVL